MLTSWTCPLPGGGTCEELAVAFDQARTQRLLVLPALFDEANKLRRQTVEVMRRLDLSGIDSFLPDLPGCNESTVPLGEITLEDWRAGVARAADDFRATHLLTLRGGVLLAPAELPGWRYAPVTGAKQLRSMLRARTIAAREYGREESIADLQELGVSEGLELAGWKLGSAMFAGLSDAAPPESAVQADIDQSLLDGAGLWLRAEPGEDPEQADALAAIIAVALDSEGREAPE